MNPATVQSRMLRSLRDVVSAVLCQLLDGVGFVALLDFPGHSNVGDSAIWLGERTWLSRHDIEVRYTCSIGSFSRSALRRLLPPGGTVLLSGGGNLGDVWPHHQDWREHVVSALRNYRIVQLPQSIHFESAIRLDQARRVFASHPDFHLLVRDRASLRIAAKVGATSVALCPDMALVMELPRRADPAVELVVLARTDRERVVQEPLPQRAGLEVVDWTLPKSATSTKSRTAALASRVRRSLQHRTRHNSLVQSVPSYQRRLLDRYDQQALAHVLRGSQILSRGRMVVTDRLHGHVLSFLLDVPHVVVDNTYGKVGAFVDTWMYPWSGLHRANTLAEGIEIAASTLRRNATKILGTHHHGQDQLHE